MRIPDINKPFIIGLYYDEKSEPASASDFLNNFIEEIKPILRNGLIFDKQDKCLNVGRTDVENEPIISLEIGNICADTPARCFILASKYSTGYFGCGRCNTEGEYIANRICFPDLDSNLRTDETFLNKIHEHFHKEPTILENIDLKCISQVPLDSMHLLYQGAMKKMLSIILKGPLQFRISTQQQKSINAKLDQAKQYQPNEFSRRIRPIWDFPSFKATELRTVLLYTEMVVFKGTVPKMSMIILCYFAVPCGF